MSQTLLSNDCSLLVAVCQATLVGEVAITVSKVGMTLMYTVILPTWILFFNFKGILAMLRKDQGRRGTENFLKLLLKIKAETLGAMVIFSVHFPSSTF